MFHNILLPVDLSNRHEKALKIAECQSTQSGGELTLFHVIELLQGALQQEEEAFYRRLEAKARSHLVRLQAQVEKGAVRCRSMLIYGDPAAEIVRHSVEMRADLIVMSSHLVKFDTPGLGWGTLSYKVAILAQCPVLLVK